MRFNIFVAAVFTLAAPIPLLGQEPTILKHVGWVAAVAFAPDGKTLASAGADNVVRLWEVGTWKASGVLKGHTDCVSAIAFTRDSRMLTTGSFDGWVKVWWLDDLKPDRDFTWKYKGAVTAIHNHDAIAWIGGVDGILRLQPISAREKELPQMFKHKSWVNGVATCDGGVATASSDGTVGLLMQAKDGTLQDTIYLKGGGGEVRCVAFDPDGELLAAGNRYGTVRIWDVASRKEVKTITGHMGDVWSIAFSPDGKTLAAVDTDWRKPSKIKLYDTTTWKERGALDTPGEILSIAYSPKGDWLAAGCWDKTVRIFPIAKAADK